MLNFFSLTPIQHFKVKNQFINETIAISMLTTIVLKAHLQFRIISAMQNAVPSSFDTYYLLKLLLNIAQKTTTSTAAVQAYETSLQRKESKLFHLSPAHMGMLQKLCQLISRQVFIVKCPPPVKSTGPGKCNTDLQYTSKLLKNLDFRASKTHTHMQKMLRNEEKIKASFQ